MKQADGGQQDRVDRGELIRWAKGFAASSSEGKEVAEMFSMLLKKYVRIPSPSCSLTAHSNRASFPRSPFASHATTDSRSPTERLRSNHRPHHRLALHQPSHQDRDYLRDGVVWCGVVWVAGWGL